MKNQSLGAFKKKSKDQLLNEWGKKETLEKQEKEIHNSNQQVCRNIHVANKDYRVAQTFSSMPNTISYNLDKISELFEGAAVRAFKACNLRA